MKLIHLAYLGSCMGSRVMVAPPTKEEIAAKTAISSTELKDLMNDGKIVKKWVFHHETGLSWGQAAEECRRSGGVLAYFDDAYDHIEALKQIPMDARFWVGYTDLGLEGLWKTVTNLTPTYMRWIEQQPDDRLDNEDCGLVIMGSWGRGRMMDANCKSPTGINEWTTPVGHLCRFDSHPKEVSEELKDQNTENFDKEKDLLNDPDADEKPLLPFEMPIPKWAQPETKRHFIDDKLMNKIRKSASLSSTLKKFEDKVKKQEMQTEKSNNKFDALKDEFNAIRNVTEAIRNDNRFIFNQLSLLKGQNAPDLAKERAKLQSNADRKESAFWVNRQKAINKGFTAGFETQKNRLETVEDNVEMLTANFTALQIEEFMEEQAEKTEYLRETVIDLVDTNDKIKALVENTESSSPVKVETLKIMQMQFQKVFETLSMILMPPEELERQQQARQGGGPTGPGGPIPTGPGGPPTGPGGPPMQSLMQQGPPMASGSPSAQGIPFSGEPAAPMAAARPDLGPSQSVPQPMEPEMVPVQQASPTVELISDSDKE